MQIRIVDISNSEHQEAFCRLLDAYMQDEMGLQKPLNPRQAQKVVEDLRHHPSYLGFMVTKDADFLALANCFVNYSTFSARRLINIHDFVVHPQHRGEGAGFFLLSGIEQYAREHDFCRINLEVREDNYKAMQLYRKFGFKECSPSMHFWEKRIIKSPARHPATGF